MKSTPIFDPSEAQAYSILQRQLKGTSFEAYPVKVKRVLKKIGARSKEERAMMACGEFDFVVMKTDGSLPIFGIEFDGRSHDREKVVRRDVVKNRMCKRKDFPLLRIHKPAIEDHNGVTLLDYVIQLFLAWNREEPNLRAMYQQGLDRSVDPPNDFPPDPETVFGINHPFPATAVIEKRLWDKHRIAIGSDGFVNGIPTVRSDRQDARAVSCISLGNTRSGDLYEVQHDVRIYYGATQVVKFSTKPFKVCGWLPVELNAPRFSHLPTLADIRTQADVDVFRETLEKCVEGWWSPRVPGVEPHNIAINFGEYLAWREVETWAEAWASDLHRFRLSW